MLSRPAETSLRTERRRSVVFVAMCVVMACWAAPVRPGIVLGQSMAPSFRDGQVFLTSRVRDSASLEPGDVVLAEVHGSVLLKRVYALGGETVWAVPSPAGSMEQVVPRSEVRRLRLTLSRQYPQQDLVRYEVPPDYVFVLGDARSNSYDSRHFGAVPSEAIRAKVVVSHLFHLWGPSRPGSGVAIASSR